MVAPGEDIVMDASVTPCLRHLVARVAQPRRAAPIGDADATAWPAEPGARFCPSVVTNGINGSERVPVECVFGTCFLQDARSYIKQLSK